ncbi:MAG: FecR family protein [Deltaproteobacteria bacterium]|nr:FecR family protein [Deltaproteobacteria bacterium]
MQRLSLALGAALFLFLSIVIIQTRDSYAASTSLKAVGKVTSVSGKADIVKNSGAESSTPLRRGTLVYEKDIIRTASGAKAEVTFNDGSVISVAPESKIEVSQYVFGADNTTRKKGVVKVYRGKMRSIVSTSKGLLSLAKLSSGDSTFETRTPVAIAGVKGTDYVTSYGLNGAAFFVNNGTVVVTNPNFPDKVIVLGAGKVTYVVSEKTPPSKAKDASSSENAAFNKDTDGGDDGSDDGTDEGNKDEGGGDEGNKDEGGGDEGTGGDNNFSENGGDGDGTGDGTGGTGDNNKDLFYNGNFMPFDDTPPTITYTGLPAIFSNQNTATITVGVNEQSDVTYTFDGGAAITLGSGQTFSIVLSPADLTEAVHTLTVTAVDAGKNTTISTYSWVSDYTPPSLSVTTGTPLLTNVKTASFDMTGSTDFSPVTFDITLNSPTGTTTYSTSSLGYTLSIPEGANTVTIVAIDAAGNVSAPAAPAYTFSWTTDYTPPTATETSSLPALIVSTAGINFGVTPSETVTYNAISTTGTSGAFAGPVLNYVPTAEGYQNFQIEITDLAGNTTLLYPYQWFYGADARGLSGQFYGTGGLAGITGIAGGEIDLLSTGGMGNYLLYTSGAYAGAGPSGAWSVYSGGQGTTMIGFDGYWLSSASGTGSSAGYASGTTQFKYLSLNEYITGTNGWYGSVSTGAVLSGSEDSYYSPLTSTPLVASGTAANPSWAFGFWDYNMGIEVKSGSLSGTAGSTADIFAGSGQVVSIGEFSNPNFAFVWGGDLDMTTAAGSVFSGGMGGVTTASGVSDAMMGGMFINPDGSTGYLFAKPSSATVDFYSPTDMFSTWGMYDFSANVTPVVMGTTLVQPVNLGLATIYTQALGSIVGTNALSGNTLMEYTRIGDQNWGTEFVRMGGTYDNTTGMPQKWTASAGGLVSDGFGTIGYTLLAFNGSSWTNGMFDGTMTDITLTRDTLSTLVDSTFIGVYDHTMPGVWEGFGYGAYTSAPITAATLAGAGSFETSRSLYGEYAYPTSPDSYGYRYEIYTNPNDVMLYGHVAKTAVCAWGCEGVLEVTFYYADGTTMTNVADPATWVVTTTYGTWDPATFDLMSLTNPPLAYDGYVVDPQPLWYSDTANTLWENYWVDYIVGTPDSLWDTTVNPAGLTYLGNVWGATPGKPFSAFFIDQWFVPVYDPVAMANTTNDGGSYNGALMVSVVDGVAKGIGIALYVDNGATGSYQAGYLDMTLSGNYYADTMMISMTGTSTPTIKNGATQVLPADLSLVIGNDVFNTRMFGAFGTGGDFYADSNAFNGGTAWIPGENWGILGAGLNASLGTVSGAWSGTAAGAGSFGVYTDVLLAQASDNGFYVASASGGYSNGFITGTFNGNYITMTSMGTLGGDVLLGMEDYNVTATGGVVGVWEQTNLLSYSAAANTAQWSNGVFNAYSVDAGTYLYLSGATYDYNIYDSPSVAIAANTLLTRADLTTLETRYYLDGTKIVCDSATGVCTASTWNPAVFSLWDLTAPITLAGDTVTGFWPPEWSGTSVSEYMTMSAILGGVGSLWALTPADITVMGQMGTTGGAMPEDFGFIVPIVSLNPYTSENITLENIDFGAFKGYLGGAAANGIMKGGVMAIYMAPDGGVGVLRAGLDGTYYPEIMSFDMTGSTVKYQKGTIGAYGPAALSADVLTSSNGWLGIGATAGASGWLSGGTNFIGDTQTSWITGADWGIFVARVVGGAYLVGDGSWTADLGGSATFGSYMADNDGYYLAQVTTGVSNGGVLTGQALGDIMTYLYLGTIDADIFFAENQTGTSFEGSVLGMWEAVTPLNHSAKMTMYETVSQFQTGYEAVFGGIDSIWDGLAHNVTSLGAYYGTGYWGTQYPKALLSNGYLSSYTYSFNALDGTQTTNDGGAYRLMFAGIDLYGSVTLMGKGIYIDPTGTKIGILTTVTDLTGTAVSTYDDTEGMLTLNGTMKAVEIATIATTLPSSFGTISGYSPPMYVASGAGSFGAGGTISVNATNSYVVSVDMPSFGVWGATINGDYSGSTSANWALNLTMSDATVILIDGTSWNGTTFAGTARGYWDDTVSGDTGIMIGEVVGVADAGTIGAIEAAAIGTGFTTQQYLMMVASGAGQTALAALNVPFAEVGVDTLSGGNGNINMTLTDVKFFAYQSGAKPLIWATDSVSGTYATTPTGGNTVSLAGSQITTATFTVNTWDNVVNNTWSGSITGGMGTLSGIAYTGPVGFEGAAAGTIDTATTFSGTAAGIVH